MLEGRRQESLQLSGSYKEVSTIEKVYHEILEDEVDESDLTVNNMEDFMEENTHRGKRSAFYR